MKYVVKDWPWNTECNFNVPRTICTQAACEAAAAVRMARDRSKAKDDEMADWLFTNQPTLTTGADAVQGRGAERILGVTDFDGEYAAQAARHPDATSPTAARCSVHVDADVLHQRRSRADQRLTARRRTSSWPFKLELEQGGRQVA